jgi:serine/threonine protein phosphatase 1
MRTFAIGDIHGGLKALLQVLNQIEITDQDSLIFMGDYVDGWSESAQVVDFLIQLSEEINCVFIKGNHDFWCE